jgi:hypothetical protein
LLPEKYFGISQKAFNSYTFTLCGIFLAMVDPAKSSQFFVIQKLYDYIMWVTPLISKLPKDRKFGIGDRVLNKLYDTMELLLLARYDKHKRATLLQEANIKLEMVRLYQRMFVDEHLWNVQRYEYGANHVNEIGSLIGAWLHKASTN